MLFFSRKGKTKLSHSDIWHYYIGMKEYFLFLFALVLAKECHYFTKNQFSINGMYRLIGPIVHDCTLHRSLLTSATAELRSTWDTTKPGLWTG